MRAFFWGALIGILGGLMRLGSAALGKSMMGIISCEMLRIGLALILSVSAIKLYRKSLKSA